MARLPELAARGSRFWVTHNTVHSHGARAGRTRDRSVAVDAEPDRAGAVWRAAVTGGSRRCDRRSGGSLAAGRARRIVGAVIGTLGGRARSRGGWPEFGNDRPAAFLEDAVPSRCAVIVVVAAS